ncbi:phosphonate C-P lyase system protein PhnG [Devosia algicola]|uniref:Phosphonate C-P lyase system protein PhnG n=1 Tax=Devosia algicola TaxID=3026418 RepID=A0ABY7YL96_9HYPH|nr:phosphonate C-P lyase system protein PhnG [Devosia algicola]WDR02076.1 phosphonate C-P lyase system protein PhnG [Devosia algicola]
MTRQADQTVNERQVALNVMAGADATQMAAIWAAWPTPPAFEAVRGPETGLVMVRGRAGGGGAPFNLGEASVSRATIKLESGEIGHGYCLGRDLEKARVIAVFDALFQRDPVAVKTRVLAPVRAKGAAHDQQRRNETAATKVDFFTMVRGDV